MKALPLWEQVLIYVALFTGLEGIIRVILQPILALIFPSLLSTLQSPNYTVSPAVFSSIVTQTLLYFFAILVSLYFIKKFFTVSRVLLFSLFSTLVLVILALLPTVQLLLNDRTVMQHYSIDVFKSDMPAIYSSLGYELVVLLIFFVLTYYFSSSKRKATSFSSFLRGS